MDEFIKIVKNRYQTFDKGHDFTHIQRVLYNARIINESEHQHPLCVDVLALCHDLYDEKFVQNIDIDTDFKTLVKPLNLTESQVNQIITDLLNFGFKGGLNKTTISKVGQIVSDADRLDAIGAIGIARTMMYGKILYADEAYSPITSIEQYRDRNRPILFHFYDKLLKLKDLMYTAKAKEMAIERHQFMLEYLEQLEKEIGHGFGV